jgi:hypothetical protein
MGPAPDRLTSSTLPSEGRGRYGRGPNLDATGFSAEKLIFSYCSKLAGLAHYRGVVELSCMDGSDERFPLDPLRHLLAVNCRRGRPRGACCAHERAQLAQQPRCPSKAHVE